MAQEFAKHFYHTRSWRHTAAAYMRSAVDLSGNVVVDVGGRYFRDDGNGGMTAVPNEAIIPPGLCERCFCMGQYTNAKLVHHKVHLTPDNIDDPSVSLDFRNLQRLCQDCHAIVHSGETEPRTRFNDDGTEERSPADSFMAQVMRLTATESELRNIHKEAKGKR